MSNKSLVLDTNILIYYFNGTKQLRAIVERPDNIVSSIVELELCSGKYLSKPQQQIISQLLTNYQVVPVDQSILDIALQLRMTYNLKPMDSIVAATSIKKDVALFSADKQFEIVKELKFLLFTPK
ncbi:MAG: PIN domain-containing protein [Flavobacteriales bacterium]|nr:PIN domain-containing protein [Flavobacteriales bacterium]